MSGQPHFSLTLSRALWSELLHASLPVRLAGRRFDALRDGRARVRAWRRELGLESPWAVPGWERFATSVARRVDAWVHVEGDWSVDVVQLGADLHRGPGAVAGAGSVRFRLAATVDLARGRLEVPVLVEHPLDVTVHLTGMHYDPVRRAVVADLGPMEVRGGGDSLLARLAAGFVEGALASQIARANPIVLLRRERVEEMIGPMGGPLRTRLGVEDFDVRIDEHAVQLNIRFGFHTDALCDTSIDGC